MLNYTFEKAFLNEENVIFFYALSVCVLLIFVYNLIKTICFRFKTPWEFTADLLSSFNSQDVVLNFKSNADYIAELKCDMKMIMNEILSAK
jgi:hypothetical protein